MSILSTPAATPRRRLGLLLVMAALFALSYGALLRLNLAGDAPDLRLLQAYPERTLGLTLRMASADIAAGQMTLALTPQPSPAMLEGRGRLKQAIEIEVTTNASVVAHTFRAGEPVLPWIVAIPFERSETGAYPFDSHAGETLVRVTIDGADVMPRIGATGATPGFRLKADLLPRPAGGDLEMRFVLKRSPAIVAFAMMGLASVGFVVASALLVAWQVGTGRRKSEFAMMMWIAALLFVIPAVRSGLPGAPPTGATIDIAGFFWMQALTVAALVVVVWRWSRQTA